jgi:hypothetical protein
MQNNFGNFLIAGYVIETRVVFTKCYVPQLVLLEPLLRSVFNYDTKYQKRRNLAWPSQDKIRSQVPYFFHWACERGLVSKYIFF